MGFTRGLKLRHALSDMPDEGLAASSVEGGASVRDWLGITKVYL